MKTILLLIAIFISSNLTAEILTHTPPVPSKGSNTKIVETKKKIKKHSAKTLVIKKKVKSKAKEIVKENNYVSFDDINKPKVISTNIDKFIKAMQQIYSKISALDPQMSHEYILDLKLPLILDQLQSYKTELNWNLESALDYANCQRDCQRVLINLSHIEDNQKVLLYHINQLSDKILLANEAFDLRVQTEKIKYLQAEYQWIENLQADLLRIKKSRVINTCENEELKCKKILIVGNYSGYDN